MAQIREFLTTMSKKPPHNVALRLTYRYTKLTQDSSFAKSNATIPHMFVVVVVVVLFDYFPVIV